jgi:hypothetical protein
MLYNRRTGIYKFGNNTYPQRIRCRSNLGHIFQEKKCVLWTGKYGTQFINMIITKHLFLNIQASMYHGTDTWDSRYHFVFCTWHFASIAVDGSGTILQKIKTKFTYCINTAEYFWTNNLTIFSCSVCCTANICPFDSGFHKREGLQSVTVGELRSYND